MRLCDYKGRLCWPLLCWSLWPRADVWNCVSHTNDNLNTAVNKTVLHCIIYCCYYSHYSLLFVLKCNFPVIAAPTHYDYDTSRTAVSALLESYNDVSQSSHFSPVSGYSDRGPWPSLCWSSFVLLMAVRRLRTFPPTTSCPRRLPASACYKKSNTFHCAKSTK